jgi:hypothetical protein
MFHKQHAQLPRVGKELGARTFQNCVARCGEREREREGERERERGRMWGTAVVGDTTIVGWRGVGNNIFGLKVPRHCPLVLLIGLRLEFRINSTPFFNFNIIGVGGAALERNLVRH